MFKKYLEMAAARPSDLTRVYYHGTSTATAAKKIMKEGIKPPDLTQRKENALTPRKGKVYITPHLEYALIYAFGANMVGIPFDPDYIRGEQNGYLFVIQGKQIQDIEPDEDDVGMILWSLARGHYNYLDKHLNVKEIEKNRWLLGYARRVLDKIDPERLWEEPEEETYGTPEELEDEESDAAESYKEDLREWENMMASGSAWDAFVNHGDGELHKVVPAAKYMLDHTNMSAEQRLKLIDCGCHIAHRGSLKPDEVWEIDKTKSYFYKPDGSNFFKIAKRIK